MFVSGEIDSRELDALADAFAGLDMDRVVEHVIPFAGKMVERRMATYPPETAANMPKRYPGRWYQRQFGPRWYNKGGKLSGRDTSERLQKSWRTEMKGKEAEVFTHSPVTETEVSYVEQVHSYENQAAVHARHGWHTDKQVAEEVEASPALDRAIEAEIDRELRRVTG